MIGGDKDYEIGPRVTFINFFGTAVKLNWPKGKCFVLEVFLTWLDMPQSLKRCYLKLILKIIYELVYSLYLVEIYWHIM